MSASRFSVPLWLMWCKTSTSVAVMSLTPAAPMQRISQRLKACAAMISPNSNSDSSGDFSETRCDEETIRCSVALTMMWCLVQMAMIK